jgi:hypothetical protein
MFETCRRQEEFNYNIDLKSAFCWLTLRDILYLVQSTLPSDTLWRTVRHSVIIYINDFPTRGARGGVVVKALRYKPADRGFDSPMV